MSAGVWVEEYKTRRPAGLDNHTALCVLRAHVSVCSRMVCVGTGPCRGSWKISFGLLHTDHVLNFSFSINEFYFLFLKVVVCVFVFSFLNVTEIPVLDLISECF